MDRASPPSKLTCRRVPRVWRFAAAPDVGAHELEQRCREWVVLHWGECWGREVGSVGKRERDALVKDTLALLRPDSVVSFYRGLLAVRARTEVEVRTVQPRGLKQTAWSDNLLGMVLELEQRIRAVFVRHLEKVVESEAFAGLLDGRGFEHELLEKMMDDLPAGVAGPESCKEAARVYQVRPLPVSPVLLRLATRADQRPPALRPGPRQLADAQDRPVNVRTRARARIREPAARGAHAGRGRQAHPPPLDADPREGRVRGLGGMGAEGDLRRSVSSRSVLFVLPPLRLSLRPSPASLRRHRPARQRAPRAVGHQRQAAAAQAASPDELRQQAAPVRQRLGSVERHIRLGTDSLDDFGPEACRPSGDRLPADPVDGIVCALDRVVRASCGGAARGSPPEPRQQTSGVRGRNLRPVEPRCSSGTDNLVDLI